MADPVDTSAEAVEVIHELELSWSDSASRAAQCIRALVAERDAAIAECNRLREASDA
jgi:hypothetical protein